jgi:hypothetical protein
MNSPYRRQEIVSRLSAFGEGAAELDDMHAWLAPFQRGDVHLPQERSALLQMISNLVEDDSLPLSRKVLLARRVLHGLRDDKLTEADVVNLFPVYAFGDRLCEISTKHRQNIVSRTSFLSFVSEMRVPPSLKRWIVSASQDKLEEFCFHLEANNFREIKKLLSTSGFDSA